jgi:hypothetical protein
MGPFVFIEASIRGNFSTGKAAQVTFTGQTWTHIQDVMDKSYPDMRILGWYHTHPGHGIFLSDMDLFIHKHFFNLPWHLAFVFDPQNQEEGLFAWRNANMAIESFVVQKDMPPLGQKVARRVPEPYSPQVQYATDKDASGAGVATPNDSANGDAAAAQLATVAPPYQQIQAPSTMAPGMRPSTQAEVSELTNRIQQLEKRQRWVTAALAVAVLGGRLADRAVGAIAKSSDEHVPTLPSARICPSPVRPGRAPPAPARAMATPEQQKESSTSAESEHQAP